MDETLNTEPDPGDITQMLLRLRRGERRAFDELFPVVYNRLKTLAHIQRTRWEGDSELNTTALVHEAYLKLCGQEKTRWQDRSHFLAVAAKAMRHILIDYARGRQAAKRGAGSKHVSLEEIRHALQSEAGFTDERADALVALDDSLQRLKEHNERYSQIVECRFFGGMTIQDTAEALGLSPATVKRAWSLALAWLYRDVKQSLDA